MANNIWKEYFEKTKANPPRSLLVKALLFIYNHNEALDLGSGALNDTIFLLKKGFHHVTAVDEEPVAKQIADTLPADKFKYIISSFETYDFPKTSFDLVNDQYSLPFISPVSFNDVLVRIKFSLKENGIFTGQLFGDRDEWIANSNMTFHTREKAQDLFAKMEIISFDEEEKDKPTATGKMKHWHTFHFIARK